MKKGSATDIIGMIVLLAFVSIGFFFMFFIFGELGDKIAPKLADDPIATTALTETMAAREAFDFFSLAVLVGSFIVALAFAMWIPANPIFYPIAIILTILGVVISVPISNVYETITTNALLSGTLSSFPVTEAIMANLPLIITIFGATIIIATYAKGKLGGDVNEIY